MKKLSINKTDVLDTLLGVMYSVLIAVGLVIIFAIIVKYTEIPDTAIMPINIAIKTVAVLLGVIFGVKNCSHGAIKGGIIGTLFMLITYLLFSLIGGSFKANAVTVFDVILTLVEGVVSGIIAVNIKRKCKKA